MSYFKKDPILRGLGKVAIITAFATLGTGLYFEKKLRSNVTSQSFYADSLKILNEKTDVIEFLGKPIGVGKIDLGDSYNYCKDKTCKVKIPVAGKKEEGSLFIFADRESSTEDWSVQRLELSVKSHPGKRILVHSSVRKEEEGLTN